MDDQLKTLFDYTKWHIGLYTGLVTALIAVLQLYGEALTVVTKLSLFFSLLCILAAGGAGGIVGSSIPFYRQFDVFMRSKLSPRNSWEEINKTVDPKATDTVRYSGKWWTHFEHTAFWLGIGIAVLGIIVNEVIRRVPSKSAFEVGLSIF